MENKLITLNGLIDRLTELRDINGGDCPIVVSGSFDSTKDRKKITMVSLDSCPKRNEVKVAILVENIVPIFERQSGDLYRRKHGKEGE